MKAPPLFLAAAAVTLGIYAAMLTWTIPAITREAGGLAVFDMRPAGYTFEEARAFLNALSEDGRNLYLGRQLPLDTAFPAFLAVTMVWSILRLAPREWGAWRLVLALPSIPGMVFDYLENIAAAAMLRAGPDGITADMVETASAWSRIKAASVTVAFAILLILLARWAFLRWRNRKIRA